jgi:hypothetical protein
MGRAVALKSGYITSNQHKTLNINFLNLTLF